MKRIKQLQKELGYSELQELINSGMVWKLEGVFGRAAMESLRSGACYLPKIAYSDYYGNRVPSRDEIKAGTTGSIELSKLFYSKY